MFMFYYLSGTWISGFVTPVYLSTRCETNVKQTLHSYYILCHSLFVKQMILILKRCYILTPENIVVYWIKCWLSYRGSYVLFCIHNCTLDILTCDNMHIFHMPHLLTFLIRMVSYSFHLD